MTTAHEIEPETATEETTTMDDSNTLVITRTLTAPPARFFEAFTLADLARQWMAPGPFGVSETDFDVRLGGHYRIVMEGPEDQTYSPSGTYEEFILNQKLVFTWKWAHEDLVTRVTVELETAVA